MGWFSPSVIVLKILLQKLWKLGNDWDDPAPEDIATAWRSWQDELTYITNHPIPRYYFEAGKQRVQTQLHGFSDASILAYGGVVYLRTLYHDTSTSVSIVCSKTKVAPLSPPGTIPRLELCGAQILSKLLVAVMDSLNIPLQDTYAWCDSTIVLCWLHMPPDRLSTYVSNRVGDTLSRIPSSHWRYVPTSSNPADLASRGMSPKELVVSTLWWQGPEWLSQEPGTWPSRVDWRRKNQNLPELKKTVLTITPPKDELHHSNLIYQYSSYDQTLAYNSILYEIDPQY